MNRWVWLASYRSALEPGGIGKALALHQGQPIQRRAGAAHALRGSAANIGALPLAELCRCAEEAALDHSKELAGFGRPIARELARASPALRRAAHASR